MESTSLIEKIQRNQKTLYLWGILLLVTLMGVFMILSLMKKGDGSESVNALASPSPSGDGLNIIGKNAKDEGIIKGAQIVPTVAPQKPKTTPKPTPKPSPATSTSPSPSPSPSTSPSPTSAPTSEPTPTPTPTPNPTESPTPSPTPT